MHSRCACPGADFRFAPQAPSESQMNAHTRNTAPMLASPRCGARTRSGSPDRSPAVAERKDVRLHGGARVLAHRWPTGIRSNMRSIRARPSKDGCRCVLSFARPETFSGASLLSHTMRTSGRLPRARFGLTRGDCFGRTPGPLGPSAGMLPFRVPFEFPKTLSCSSDVADFKHDAWPLHFRQRCH
jgi:hypothetical protein